MLIDSHAHLGSMEGDSAEYLDRAKQAGVSAIVNICTDAATLQKGLALAKSCNDVYNTAATTPHDVEKEGESLFPLMAHHARQGDLVAVGETGLDYHYEHSNRLLQQYFLRRYLALAIDCSLPVVIHCRDAFDDLFRIIDEDYTVNGVHRPGVLHCFTGTMAEAQQVVQRGWFLSFSGIVTFKKSEELRKVAAWVPIENMLIETDSPYLAPQPFRGKPNEPAYLIETANTMATIKEMTVEELGAATANNAKKLFKIH
ncbi:TatD family hydrolase [Simkania negevensis]|uniref:TatD family hydrolase n=1 Tax=Simkania negevensis TaxID=83561 RepID=A0ABS3ASA4_9BACT|nr:TatD family hydrolase [Simkania negevensis]